MSRGRGIIPMSEQMVRYLVRSDGCWEWTGTRTRPGPDGYGCVTSRRVHAVAHRAVYELLVGPIPEGLQLDHLCRNRLCCNPEHLEPVTPQENSRRGRNGWNMAAKTHCPQGHEYSDENTARVAGRRVCRECSRRRARHRYQDKVGNPRT